MGRVCHGPSLYGPSLLWADFVMGRVCYGPSRPVTLYIRGADWCRDRVVDSGPRGPELKSSAGAPFVVVLSKLHFHSPEIMVRI